MKTHKKNQISGHPKELSIYIHIPFCEIICPYCDFNKYSKVDDLIPDFVQSIIKEIERNSKEFADSRIVSVSFGGGTPSYLSNKDLTEIFTSLKNNFHIDKKFEFSIEVNPVDVNDVFGDITKNQSYYNLRPDIAIPNDMVLPITDQLGLHPSLTHLANFWNQGKLCIVENVGYNNQNLSHFRSTDIWQSGSDSEQILNTGWIARILEQIYPDHAENLPEIPMALLQGTTNNLLLTGEQGITGIMVDDPSNFLYMIDSTYYDSADNVVPDTAGGDELKFIRNIDKSIEKYQYEFDLSEYSSPIILTS